MFFVACFVRLNSAEPSSAQSRTAEADVATDSDAFWSKQICYPSAVELVDGAVVVVWDDLELSREWQPGEIRAARVGVA